MVQELKGPYSEIPVIVGCSDRSEMKSTSPNVLVVDLTEAESESHGWKILLGMVDTPFVLIGRALHALYSPWMNIERSIRLMQSKT